MDEYMVILRLFHIFAGVYWIGAAMLMTFFIAPTVGMLGPDGGKFMQTLLLKTRYDMAIGLGAVLTLISGLLMFWETSDGLNGDWFSTSQGTVLSIGAVAGILAFGHGIGALGRKTQEMKALAQQIVAQGGPPTPEQGAQIQSNTEFMQLHSKISLGLAVIAVAGMATFRYF